MAKWFACAAACLFAFVLVGAAAAADEKDSPTGTWKWSTTFNDQTRESTLKLKLEGDKLTGGMLGRNDQETAIEEASFKDGTVSFKVTRDRGGQKSTSKYSGKVAGDTITGKIEGERDGKATSRDWTAKRAK